MAAHVIVSSYFGDYEFDVGASVRWHQYFFRTLFAMDINQGNRSRNHLVAWADSFPGAKFAYSLTPFFGPTPGPASVQAAAKWRRHSFNKARKAWRYQPDDWVFFLDATECLTFDTESGSVLPANTFSTDDGPPLGVWVDEILAGAAGSSDPVYFPFWVYTRSSAPWFAARVVDPATEDTADLLDETGETFNGYTADDLRRMNRSFTQINYQNYTKAGHLPRAFRVSQLLDPDFDWTLLDAIVEEPPPAASPSSGASLVSYAYARYAEQGHIDPSTGGAEDEAHDVGWTMRKLISRVRPVDGLQTDDWADPDTAVEYQPAMVDDPTTSAPYAPPPAIVGSGTDSPEFSADFSADFSSFERRLIEPPGAWAPGEYQLDTPLYPFVPLRKAPRDGLFYLSGEKSVVPWNFVANRPALDPAVWLTYQK